MENAAGQASLPARPALFSSPSTLWPIPTQRIEGDKVVEETLRKNVQMPELEAGFSMDGAREDESGLDCLNLSTIVGPDGSVNLTQEHMVYLDDEGNPAIRICGYQYHLSTEPYGSIAMNVEGDSINIYCENSTLIEGNDYNYGFFGDWRAPRASVRNCHLQHFLHGVKFATIGRIESNLIQDCPNGAAIDLGCGQQDAGYVSNNRIESSYIGIGKACAMLYEADNITLDSNEIMNTTRYGIIGSNVVITNNSIHGPCSTGISTSSVYRSKVIGNTVDSCANISIRASYMPFAGNHPLSLHVETNHVMGSKHGIVVDYRNMPEPDLSSNYLIKNNVVRGFWGWGIIVDGENHAYSIIGSIVEGNTVSNSNLSIGIVDEANDITVRNNNMDHSLGYGLFCTNATGVSWRCNDCHGGQAYNDQCAPAAFCQKCGSSSPAFIVTKPKYSLPQ
ncbi:MAG: right-handed parallel beta-helix repeat-containing protein [Nanoarchaeota archaeon]